MNIYIIINILVAIILLYSLIKGYKKGFIYEIVNLIYTILTFLIAWFIAPVLANILPLIKLGSPYDLLGIEPIINTVAYYAIVVIIFKLLGFFIMPLFNSLSKLPLLGSLNKLLGLCLGFINASIIIVAISILLNMPLIKDGKEIKENTIFKYVDIYSNKAMEIIVNNIDFSKLKFEIDNFDVEKMRNDFKIWLLAQGVVN